MLVSISNRSSLLSKLLSVNSASLGWLRTPLPSLSSKLNIGGSRNNRPPKGRLSETYPSSCHQGEYINFTGKKKINQC